MHTRRSKIIYRFLVKESQAFRRQAVLKAIIYYLFKNWFKKLKSVNCEVVNKRIYF